MTAPGSVTPPAPGWWVKRNRLMFPTPTLLTLTGAIPTVSTPRLLRPTGGVLTLTGSAPTISFPGTFDAIGGGGNDTSLGASFATASWSHTCTGNSRYVFVGVSCNFAGSDPSADVTGYTRTATYGGNAMTSLGVREEDDNNPGPNGTGWVEMFGLASPPTGAQTVVIVTSAGGNRDWSIAGNSVSYRDVTSVSAATTDAGNSAGLTITASSALGHRAVCAFSGRNALSAFNQTQRVIIIAGSPFFNLIIGDAVGAASVNFTATQTSAAWSGVVVDVT